MLSMENKITLELMAQLFHTDVFMSKTKEARDIHIKIGKESKHMNRNGKG